MINRLPKLASALVDRLRADANRERQRNAAILQ